MLTSDWVKRAEQGLAELGVEQVKDSGILPDRGEKFFPVVAYPPLTMFTDLDESALFHNLASRPEYPTIAYLHMPFCPTRCTFCHWVTKTHSKEAEVDVYIDYLLREMELYTQKMGVSSIPARSVLWGGGTPTYPTAKQLERLLKGFTKYFDLSGCTQFSVEAEPTTLLGKEGMDRLKVLLDYGVTRLSLGVQAFDDKVLAYMGRAHDHAQTVQSVEQMRKAGVPIIFIDLIYGYPNLTVERWAETMLQAVQMDIDGFQLYRLRVKQHGDRPGKIIEIKEKHPERFPSADETFVMKYLGTLIAEEHGFGEHQARLFAKKPNDISHYLRDWCCDLTDVVGVGVSSWTNLRGVFSFNVGDTSLKQYYDLLDQGKIPINRGKIRTDDDETRRSFLVPLKNNRVDKAVYLQRTGANLHDLFGTEIAWFKDMNMIAEDDRHIWLTKRGRFFADEVCSQFFNPQYLPFPEIRRPTAQTGAGSETVYHAPQK